ncbi:guanylate-binding protein 6-like [Branchiostoma floridae x Branchiostoma japonicum]
MSGLHSKLGFKVEELKPKSGVKHVHGSSIPLILPNDLKYNASTGSVEKAQGVRRESLNVVPEALALLEGIEEPVSVLAICGPCRSGKTYILSRLLGTPDAFELGHRIGPPFGIWMGTKVLRGKDFTIVLLDTEGIDATGASADQNASILVLTTMLSSQLIYNSLNLPYKGDLEKMQCFIKLAKGITVKKGEKTHMTDFSQFFPDFLWLLRDVSPKLTDHNGVEIDPSEYLKTRVLGRQAEDYYDESTSDKVGRAILTFFPSVECAILERPSNDTEILNNIAHHTSRLNPGFNKGVDNLTERLLLKACAKRGYDRGSTVNGVALSIMAKQYVEAVNDPKAIPDLNNTWRNTIELMENRAIEEAVTEYNMQMQAQIARATNNGRVPLEENTGIERIRDPDQVALMDLHNEVLHEVTEMLLERVRHLGISSGDVANENNVLVDQMQKRLVQREECTVEYVAADGTTRKQEGFVVNGGELLQYIQQNKQLSKLFCQTLFARLFDPIRKHSESPPPDFDLQALIEERDRARQQYV